MKEDLKFYVLLLAWVLQYILTIYQAEVIDSYEKNFECHKQNLDYWYHKCDSLIDLNYELANENYNLKDTIIILKYKED